MTHKTKAKKKRNNVWDDYNILEFLGDSIIKFFNCKRIIKMKDKLLQHKEKGFSDIQRLKFIKTNAEKNHLFAYMCVVTGIQKYIRHSTNNGPQIQKYVDFVNEKKDDLMIEDTVPYFLKMLADVIESIIGAIMVDSCSLQKTEDAWIVLFEKYLKKFADNPAPPPKRAFGKFCESTVFLKDIKDAELVCEQLTKDQLKEFYNLETKNSLMKYDLVYKGKVIFRRYYETSVKSKDKLFYKNAKSVFKKYVVPLYTKVLNNPKKDPYLNIKVMREHDMNGDK